MSSGRPVVRSERAAIQFLCSLHCCCVTGVPDAGWSGQGHWSARGYARVRACSFAGCAFGSMLPKVGARRGRSSYMGKLCSNAAADTMIPPSTLMASTSRCGAGPIPRARRQVRRNGITSETFARSNSIVWIPVDWLC
jgi:hypothetical protein